MRIFIDCLQRHLAVCAQRDLPRMARMDPGFWNVISVREPTRPEIATEGFTKIHTVIAEVPEILLAIRRQAAPNPLILESGLVVFLPPEEARQLVVEWVNHPILFANRMGGEPGG